MNAIGRIKTEIIFIITSFYQLEVSFHNLIRANITENKNEDAWDKNSYICCITWSLDDPYCIRILQRNRINTIYMYISDRHIYSLIDWRVLSCQNWWFIAPIDTCLIVRRDMKVEWHLCQESKGLLGTQNQTSTYHPLANRMHK